jgi:2',3'-cyclic-nucleotide 2'-phosphodiesterase (5'-nucleotidase family)
MQTKIHEIKHAIVVASLGVLAFFMAGLPASAAEVKASFHCPASQTCLNFVTFNDVYEWAPYPKTREGTLSRVSTYLKEIRQRFPEAQVLFAGDTLSPSPESSFTQGLHMIQSLNALGVSTAALGNHELDFKGEGLAKALNASKFPWLSANIRLLPGAPVEAASIKPYTIIEQKGKRILVFGLLTPETNDIAPVEGLLRVEDPIATAKENLPKWRALEKPDAVIALTHLNIAEDRTLAMQVPGIDAILGGHDHHQIFQQVNGVPIIKLDSDARTIGHVQLNFGENRTTVDKRTWYQPKVTITVPEMAELHYEVTALVPQHYPGDTEFENRIKAGSNVNLDGLSTPLVMLPAPWPAYQEQLRNRYSPVAYSMTELLRQHSKSDVALLNGGGIRSNSTLEAGPITQRDVLQLLPFGNELIQLSLTGQQLEGVLTFAFNTAAATPNWGGYPHVAGVTVVKRLATAGASAGFQFLETASQAPLSRQKTYTLAVNRYLVEGGNGYPFPTLLKQGAKALPLGMTQAEALTKALRATTPLTLARLLNEPPNSQIGLQPVDAPKP